MPYRTAAFILVCHRSSPRCLVLGRRCSTTFEHPGRGPGGQLDGPRAPPRAESGASPAPARGPRGRRRAAPPGPGRPPTRCRTSGSPSRRRTRAPRSSSAVSPGEVAANTMIRPPGRVASMAWRKGAWPRAARNAQSAPRPPVSARDLARARRRRRVEGDRPHPAAGSSSRRSGSVSVAITSAPAQRQSCIRSRPIGPCPTTSTVCPFATRALRTAFRQVFTGSTKAASSGSTPSGTGMAPRSTIQSQRLHVLGEAAARRLEPGRGAVALVALALRVGRRARSRSRRRRGCGGGATTRSPFAEAADARRPGDRARDLVAEDAGAGQQPLLDLLDVGAADAAGVHPDQHLAGPDLGDGDLLDPQVARSPGRPPPSLAQATMLSRVNAPRVRPASNLRSAASADVTASERR